jgi:hypothetical protein
MKKTLTVVTTLSVLGLAPAGASAAATSSPASLAHLSAGRIATIALASARAEGTCTTVSHGASIGLSFTETTHSGATRGEQFLRVNGATGETLLIGTRLYTKLSAPLIDVEFGTPAPQYANEWLSLPASAAIYHQAAFGLSFATMISQVRPAGTLKRSAVVTLDGVKVIAVSGIANAHLGLSTSTQTLFVAAAPPHLPVALDAAGRSRGVPSTLTVTFSRWGRPLTLVPPAKVVPLAATTLR